MNRISNASLSGGRSIPARSMHRRERSHTGIPKERDENLDLFSRNRRSLTISSADEFFDVTMKLERISVGSEKLGKNGKSDLLLSVDGGKHDYDWLLTPPGTPQFQSSDANEVQGPRPTAVSLRSSSLGRSTSTTTTSRLSVSQSENGYSSRPTRSSSVTRPSISAASYNTYSSSRSSSMLNTSMSSVASVSRPSTPNSRSSLPSNMRSSSPSAHPITSRSSTPVRSRPLSSSSSGERTRVSQSPRPSSPNSRSHMSTPRLNSRPSSPTSRSHISTSRPNSRPSSPTSRSHISTTPRLSSRPSTPTRKIHAPAPVPAIGRSLSAGRVLSNDRNVAPLSRGSSPGPRARPTQQAIVLSDFPLSTPPNLRTTLMERPISAGRSRPVATATPRANIEPMGPMNPQRRQSSPVITRGRLPDSSGKNRLPANGHENGYKNQKMVPASELSLRKHTKVSMPTENAGYGRSISKNPHDMNLRHMDTRSGSGSIRTLPGSTLFPQSVRMGKPRGQPDHMLCGPASDDSYDGLPISNYSKNVHYINRPYNCESLEDDGHFSGRISEPDIYESSRYNAILFSEDLKSTNWLHGYDEKSELGSVFDHRFEPLPEPFGPL